MKFFGKTSTLAVSCTALIMGIGLVVLWHQYVEETEKTRQLEEQLVILTKQEKQSVVMQRVNAQMEEIANQERRISDEQREKAEHQTAIAEMMRQNAESERQNALEAERRAVAASEVAKNQRTIADQQRIEAEYQKRVADTLGYLTLARQLGDVAIKQMKSGNQELATLLAYAAQMYNMRYRGNDYVSDVYQSLVMCSNSRHNWSRHKGIVHDLAFYNDGTKHFVTCSGYGELMEHIESDGRLTTTTLLQDSRFDFRDVFINRTKKIIYAVSRTGHLVLKGNNLFKVIPVDNLGTLIKLEPLNNDMLLVGERGMAIFDMEKNAITRTCQLPYKVVSVHRYDNYPCIFDDHQRMLLIKGLDKIESTKLPFDGQVTSFASSKSTKIKAYGMNDGSIWYVNPQGKMQKLVGHRSRVTKMKIIDWRIHSASYDGLLNLWIVDRSKIEPMPIIQNDGWIMNFTFDDKKEAVWCSDQKGNIAESLISIPMMRQMLKNRLKRNMTHEEWNYYIGKNIPYETFIGRKEGQP